MCYLENVRSGVSIILPSRFSIGLSVLKVINLRLIPISRTRNYGACTKTMPMRLEILLSGL